MVEIINRQICVDGQPVHIRSGAVHYFRSFPEQWHGILEKLKYCGLNTVETYVCWNLHEPEPGHYDFSGRLDFERFLKTAGDLGLYVILRPGPYICGEWDLGGLPFWLLKDENIRLRTEDPAYMAAVNGWFDVLMPHLVPHLQTNGGNVILVAAENEYGSFGNSTTYMNACAAMLTSRGVDVPLFTADGHTPMFLYGGHADGAFCALDFGYERRILPHHFAALDEFRPNTPHLQIEQWIGAISHWGDPTEIYEDDYAANEVNDHLKQGSGFNLYMFHGGTNFGITSGANVFNRDPENLAKPTYLADITSYDYGGLLTDWGECTPKYFAVKRAIEQHTGERWPTPVPVPTQNIGEVALTEAAELFDNLAVADRFESPCLYGMEHFGKNCGYILYRTQIRYAQKVERITFGEIRDRVHIYFNGIYRGTLDRNAEKPYLETDAWLNTTGTLDLLVENMGRVNFGPEMFKGDRKGLTDTVFLTGTNGPRQMPFGWEIYCLPVEGYADLSFESNTAAHKNPTFFKGTFHAEPGKECFIHPEGFTKGFILVNGFNLGRYWEIGPQRSLYLPSPLLKEENEIIVFDERPQKGAKLFIRDNHILNETVAATGPETVV